MEGSSTIQSSSVFEEREHGKNLLIFVYMNGSPNWVCDLENRNQDQLNASTRDRIKKL